MKLYEVHNRLRELSGIMNEAPGESSGQNVKSIFVDEMDAVFNLNLVETENEI